MSATTSPAGTAPAHPTRPHPIIRCDRLSKSYGTVRVMENLSLDIAPGEFISLLGPSGSGKTTLLMMIAGFEEPTEGAIWLDGRRIDAVAPFRRNMGMVFQNYALFPHMTVAQNIGFPLKMRGTPRREIAGRVARALEMIELGALADRYPPQLSGGQQQRVALARALVFEPRVVLMDEPLGALDKRLREQMQLDIRDLHRRLGLTVIFVTHDQSEALTMSDRIAVFNKGRIEQIGTPDDIYDRPRTRFVAEFIGETNLLTGRISGGQLRLPDETRLALADGNGAGEGDEVVVSVRPERMRVIAPGTMPEPGANRLEGALRDVVYLGDHLRLQIDAAGQALVVKQPRAGLAPQPGARVALTFDAADTRVITS